MMSALAIAAFIAAQAGIHLDAVQTATLARQLEYVKAQTYDVKYPAFQARNFIPVSTEVPAGAQTITYRQWDQYGMAKVVANYADDIPLVDVVAREFTTKVKSLADGYTFSVEDLAAMAMSGQPIDTMKAMAARRAIEASMDEVAAFGLPEANMPGFVNHPNVPLVSPTTGDWSNPSTTVAQILADLTKLVKSVVVLTKGIHKPDTILFDTDTFEFLASTPTGANLDTTILRAFLNSNPHIKNVDTWHKLDTADVAGTGPRVICYLRDPEVLQLEIPQDFTQLPPQARNLAFVVPCMARIGGTVIRYPLAMAYMDGV